MSNLSTALKLAPRPVTVLTPKPLGMGASSAWAQGGVAAAMGEGDSAHAHALDTEMAGAGIVEVSAQQRDRKLCLRVCDNGPGVPAGWDPELNTGIGLSTTIARLRQLYGEEHSFRIEPRAQGGTCAEVTFPLREVMA